MLDNLIISTAAYDGYSLEECLQAISSLGVHYVELAFISGYTEPFTEDYFNQTNADMTLALLAKYNLKCCSFSSHVDLSSEGIVDIFKKRMIFAKAVGSDTIVTNASPTIRSDIFYANMEVLSKFAEEIDLKIGLENPGDGVDNVLNKGSDGKNVLAKINSTHVGVNYDFGNLLSHCFEKVRPEPDYLDCIKETIHYHVKDVQPDQDGWAFTPIGSGSIDYKTILQEISQRDTRRPVSLEIPVRLRRDKNAQPERTKERIALPEIQDILSKSIAFVKEVTQ